MSSAHAFQPMQALDLSFTLVVGLKKGILPPSGLVCSDEVWYGALDKELSDETEQTVVVSGGITLNGKISTIYNDSFLKQNRVRARALIRVSIRIRNKVRIRVRVRLRL